MNLKVAFAGAHRTGKTTLAKGLAAHYSEEFIPASVSDAKIWQTPGFDMAGWMTFAERLTVQEALVEHLFSKYAKMTIEAKNAWITDRSPFDLLAYLYANIDQTTSELFSNRIRRIEESVRYIAGILDYIIVVQPGLEYPVTDDARKTGKIFQSYAYQEAINLLVIGSAMAMKPESVIIIPSSKVELNDRMNFVLDTIENRF